MVILGKYLYGLAIMEIRKRYFVFITKSFLVQTIINSTPVSRRMSLKIRSILNSVRCLWPYFQSISLFWVSI